MSAMTTFAYTSTKTGNLVNGVRFDDGDSETRPFDVFKLQAVGLLHMLNILGDHAESILGMFADGTELESSSPDITFSEFKGHPMLNIHGTRGDKAVSMGRSKARKLAAGIAEHGFAAVYTTLTELVGDYVPKAPKSRDTSAPMSAGGRAPKKDRDKAAKAGRKAARATEKARKATAVSLKPAKGAGKAAKGKPAKADPRDAQIAALKAQMKAMQDMLAKLV